MTPWLGLDRLVLALARKIIGLLVRTIVLPEEPGSLLVGEAPVCYVLETDAISNALVLDQVCIERGLSRALLPLEALDEQRSFIRLRKVRGWFDRRPDLAPSPRLQRLVAAAEADSDLDVQIVPVSVFWGRSPDKEHSWFKLLFAENWTVTGRIRKLLIILIHGRHTLVHFSPPISLREFASEGLETQRAVRKLYRVLRVHFRLQRVATIGPDLSHRRTLVSEIVASRSVRRVVERETGDNKESRRKILRRARKYADEIAADYSYSVVRMMERILGWWWNRRFDGIEIHNVEALKSVAEGNEIIYVPCHRSHVDYLLLSYVLYQNGLVVPHIAAGINLDLPLIGPILRRGGAFFMRRSFRGNRLYAAVFQRYLGTMLERGFPIEYFIEGTRSRTGRLLEPKAGMLTMTLRSYLNRPRRRIVFMPVYVGYEQVFEGRSYISELSGASKRKESVFGLMKALRSLRHKYGKVYVNFGEALFLDTMLDEELPDWRTLQLEGEDRPAWLPEVVKKLAREIMVRINDAASVNPINLLASVLLSTPKQAMVEKDLQYLLELYADLAREAPYSERVTVSEMKGHEIIAYGEAMGVLVRRAHALGDVLYLQGDGAVLMTYFRNNVQHLYALPSTVACCFLNNRAMSIEQIVHLGKLVYPFMRSELFLRWNEEELGAVLRQTIDFLVGHGLLVATPGSDMVSRPPAGSVEAVQLSVLAQGTLQTIERFYMTMAVLFKHGSGNISQSDLENLCYLMAQRITLLHEFDAPEFFAKPLFRNFIHVLKERGVLRSDENGVLWYDDSIRAVEDDARRVLSEQMRHSILQVTHV